VSDLDLIQRLLGPATSGAALAHLEKWGLFSHHGDGTFWECTDPRCVGSQELINEARAMLGQEPHVIVRDVATLHD
jgi:hypothetical protein